MSQKLIAMNNLLYHRGRDDGGYFLFDKNRQANHYADHDSPSELFSLKRNIQKFESFKNNQIGLVGLSHRRLSIRDLSPNGHQPMFTHNSQLVIVYNGEVYNSEEIKNELIQEGYEFETKTDTEVILKAFEKWNIDSFQKLNGMFAFIIFDQSQNKLYLCRDRFGIKPLYYAQLQDTILFSSELKPIHHVIKASPSYQVIYDYLYLKQQNLREDLTFFNEIKKIPPGSYAEIDSNLNIKIKKWYHIQLKLTNTQPSKSKKEQEEIFKNLLVDSVKLRLISDVPVGTALSGGLDSSTIVSCIHSLIDNSNNIKTFSSVFNEPEANEKAFIDDVIQKLQVSNASVSPSPEELNTDINDLIYCQEEPFLSLGMYAQYCVMRLASKSVKVTLDGQGGDEILAGYHRFFPSMWKDLFNRLKWKTLLMNMYGFQKEFGFSSMINWMILSNRKNVLRYQKINNFNKFFNTDFNSKEFLKNPEEISGYTNLQKNMLSSIYQYGLPAYLHHADRNSMNFTVESRIPFLDFRLVEFCLNLPCELLLQPAETKHIMRQSFQKELPQSVFNRKDKLGFPTPQQRWQRMEPMKNTLSNLKNTDWIFECVLEKKTFLKHRDQYLLGKNNDWQTIWQTYCLNQWHNIFFNEFNYFNKGRNNESILA